jgi:predicted nucleic acid-binding protein
MNGTKYFLDTNAIIALLKGNAFIHAAISDADWIGTSAICVIEFLSFPQLSDEDVEIFNAFLRRIEVIGISNDLPFLAYLAVFKSEKKLKLPDAVIAATAIYKNATLISNDKHFQNINKLSVLNF